eukprot:m.248098 g.248098  ORF g.248098 m.248098 type:complete len:1204 (+) comp10971_c1_seq2:642-4253(+)
MLQPEEGNRLTFMSTILPNSGEGSCEALALLDSGADICIVSPAALTTANIPILACPPVSITVAGSTTSAARQATFSIAIPLHGREPTVLPITAYVIDDAPLILSEPFQRAHKIDILRSTTPISAKIVHPTSKKPTCIALSPTVCSPKRAAKSFKRTGTEYVLCHVRHVADSSRDFQPTLSDDGGSLTPDQERTLEQLLTTYADVLPDSRPATLPPQREVDHRIELIPDAAPTRRRGYRMTPDKLRALKEILNDGLHRGILQRSSSEFASPVLLVKKKDGNYRMVADFTSLNAITRKTVPSLPLIDDLIASLSGAQFLSTLDLASGFDQVRLHPESVPYTAITTPFGLFEFNVMAQGLTGAPACFQRAMNTTLHDAIGSYAAVFIDDILVYSKSFSEHMTHLETVLSRLRADKWYCKPSKCHFASRELNYLGFRVSGDTVRPTAEKIHTITNWPRPRSIRDVRSFNGFASFYRRFVPHLADISKPLMDIQNSQPPVFNWSADADAAFEAIRKGIINAPSLKQPRFDLPTRLTTDASDYALGGVLEQRHSDDWYPLGFYSRQFRAAERNWDASEKEAIGVIDCCKHFRFVLLGVDHFDIYTDNIANVALRTNAEPSPKQMRWRTQMAQYNYTIHHVKGTLNRADAISRLPAVCEPLADDHILHADAFTTLLGDTPDLNDTIRDNIAEDPHFARILERLDEGHPGTLAQFSYENGILYHITTEPATKRICVPSNPPALRVELLERHHDDALAGHPGADATYELLTRNYFWPRMAKDASHHVQTCKMCQQTKHHGSHRGRVHQISVPPYWWHTIAADFIGELPTDRHNFNAALVIIDMFTRRVRILPTRTDIQAPDAVRLFDSVVAQFGLPRVILTDRDTLFRDFWKELWHARGVEVKQSVANHAQTNGMCERANQKVKQQLTTRVNFNKDDWSEHVTHVEFSINNTVHSATGFTPFFLDMGRHPISPSSPAECDTADMDVDDFLKAQLINAAKAHDANLVAQQKMIDAADKHRSAGPPLKVGDLVFVRSDNLLTAEERARPRKAFSLRWAGPFPITNVAVEDTTFDLALPPTYRAHNRFHREALKLFHDDPDGATLGRPGYEEAPPPDDDGHHAIDAILTHDYKRGVLKFLTSWIGRPQAESEFLPYDAFVGSDGVVAEQLLDYCRLHKISIPAQPIIDDAEPDSVASPRTSSGRAVRLPARLRSD